MFSRVLIYCNNLGDYRLIRLPIRFKSLIRKNCFSWSTNSKKLENSISRAKNKIFDYAINNDFAYFVTLTFNGSFDDYNLEMVRNRVQQLIRDCRKKYNSSFQFLLIPERHKKGDWHLHGLFTSDFKQDFYVNDYHYLSWKSFDKYGFSSIEEIRDYKSCCKYITKYVGKDFGTSEVGNHLYFCSKDLKVSEKLYDLVCTNFDLDFTYDSTYCSILDFSQSESSEILEKIENCFYQYYNSVTDID